MLARLVLTPSKLASLAGGLRQIAATSNTVLGRIKRHTKVAEVIRCTFWGTRICIQPTNLKTPSKWKPK